MDSESKEKTKKTVNGKPDREAMEWIDKICRADVPLKMQIPLIISQIEAEPIFYQTVSSICENLEQLLKLNYWKTNARVQSFGSAQTKLALKDSDVDLFIDFKGSVPNNFLKSLRKQIFRGRQFFRPIPIFASVPILKCIHCSGISCDISFLNCNGISNSKLIEFLLDYDERLRPLILILKFLMKKEEVTAKCALNSYSIIILIIFFVQQLEKPLIPPISCLQNLVNSKKIEGNWNVAFACDLNIISPSDNHMSVPELLKNFLKFYSAFDFGFHIISSFTGKYYLKSAFESIDTVPEEFSCYKENVKNNSCCKYDNRKFMCVQGPFFHNNNITKNVTLKGLINFQNFCQEKLSVLEKLDKKDGEYENMFFNVLLKHGWVADKVPKEATLYIGQYLDIKDIGAYTEDTLMAHWCEIAVNKLTDSLIRILKCKVTPYANPSKEDCTDTLMQLKDFIVPGAFKYLICELNQIGLINNTRKKAWRELGLPKYKCAITKEEMISNYLCETVLKNVKNQSFKFVIKCIMKKHPTRMHLIFDCIENVKSQKNLYYQIFNFLKRNFIKWVQSVC